MRIVVLSALALAGSLIANAQDLNDPAAELASFKLAPGFAANLFASEAEGVVKPIQMRWDVRGRLWVIGSKTYPQIKPGEEPNDQVIILEDTDHDGRADKTTVFADHLMIPTGLELDGDGHGAWVGEGTKLWHMRDTDGDDRADTREVVLRGFGVGDAHQNLNSFRWSPGGELLFCQGLHASSHVETPSGLVNLEEAGFWRYRPGTRQLEGFFGGKTEPQNPWGWAFTEWGMPLVVAGNNGGAYFPLAEMVPGHDETRVTNIWVEARVRKSSGPDIVGTAHLPLEWQGLLLNGGYINNAVWTLKLEEDGAGFRLSDLPPLLTSSHTSFRPVDLKIGPDGAIYLCDWYNPIIGHYQASFRHPDRDKVHGRIWRITYPSRPLVTPPRIADASIPELLENFRSPERWVLEQSRRALSAREPAAVIGAIQSWVSQIASADSAREHLLYEALAVCESVERPQPELLQRVLQAKNPGARAYAAGVVGRWSERLPDPLAMLRPLMADEQPRVRLAAVVAAANVARPGSLEVALGATALPRDRFLDSALHQAVVGLKPQWLPLLQQHALNLSPAGWILLARADGTPDTVGVLRERLHDAALPPEEKRQVLEAMAEVGAPEDLALLLSNENFSPAVAETLGRTFKLRHVLPAGDLSRLLPVRAANEAMRGAGLRLAGLYKSGPLLPVLTAALQETGPIQQAAIDGLAALGGPKAAKALVTLAGSPRPLPERIAAVSGLAAVDATSAARQAAVLFALPEAAPQISPLLDAFLQRKKGADALAAELQEHPPATQTAAAALQRMQSSGHQEPALLAVLSGPPGTRQPLRATPEFVGALMAEVKASGNAQHGDAVFHSATMACLACHAVGGQGGTIGPSLDAIGSGQPLDFIIGAVLDPQKEVKESFEALEVTTKEGQILQGYRVHEDLTGLVLRDVATGKETTFRREQIAQKRELGSLMPYGLVDLLSREELRDLFRYLSELGKPKP